jgi:hypothetical protein
VITLPPDACVGEDDDGDPFVLTPRVRLDADHGCFRRLGWRCALLGEGSDPLSAVPALLAQGYAHVGHSAGLVELLHPEGHRLVLVTRSLRIQLRLDMATRVEARVATALALAEQLAALAAPSAAASAPPGQRTAPPP